MGIPSYYRKLTRSCPQLVQRSRPDGAKRIQWFFMDFNCLIYHCLHRPGAPVYPVDPIENAQWEAVFISSVIEYTLAVIQQVRPEKGVYLAIDGVVPMAKMRQQRLRRFTSSWMKRAAVDTVGSWNTNAITPGTAFMDQLYAALQACFKKEGNPLWKISSCREWGEGEHKILAEWRKGGYSGPIAVYGLDADLIVLSLLGQETVEGMGPVYLFREEMDRGAVQYDADGQESYEWFSVQELRSWLVRPYVPDKQRSFILQYCFMMSLLGNDFLPSSLSYKMRDEGHSTLLDLVYRFFDQDRLLVCADTCDIRWEGVHSFFKSLAHDEPVRVLEAVRKKQSASYHCETQSEFHVVGHNDWPLSTVEEGVLLGGQRSSSSLHPTWKTRYLTRFFHGFPDHPRSIQRICDAYLYGVQWVWSYYMGRMDNVCFNWYYPFSLPPLWEWLTASSASTSASNAFPGTIHLHAWDISPTEQLALVLPIESWSLLPACPEKKLPYKAPHLFPTEFSFDSVGKRFFWECESMIPLPTMMEVKAWIAS